MNDNATETIKRIFPGIRISETISDDRETRTITGFLGTAPVFTLWTNNENALSYFPRFLNESPDVVPMKTPEAAIAWLQEKAQAIAPVRQNPKQRVRGWAAASGEKPAGFGESKAWNTPGPTRAIRVPVAILDGGLIEIARSVDDEDIDIVNDRLERYLSAKDW